MLKGFTRPKPIAWFFFLLGFGLCVMAGTWQLNRLAWKENLIAEIAAANEAKPITRLPNDKQELEKLQFRKAKLYGTWRGDIEFHLAPRYWKNQFGYWVITPFILADGRTIMVNRGWVPAKNKLAKTRPETEVYDEAVLKGLIRVGNERSYFTPENQPEKNVWFGRDVEQMAAFAKLKNTVPIMLDIVGLQNEQLLPVPSDGKIRLRNDHLGYVITWYGIAAGILAIFLAYHRKKNAPPSPRKAPRVLKRKARTTVGQPRHYVTRDDK